MAEENSICAFERTLLAEGDRDAALFSLRLETAVPLTHVETEDPGPFASAVAFIVDDASIVEELRFWSPDELITLLTYWGAIIEMPAESPGVPFILVAQRVPRALNLFIYRDGRVDTPAFALRPPAPNEATALASAGPLRWLRETDENRLDGFALTLTTPSGSIAVGRLSFPENGPAKFEWADPTVVVPFTPAIYLRAGP
jgi:hypothetical protein